MNNQTSGNTNIPRLSVGQAIHELAEVYVSVIRRNIPIRTIPAPFLWGPPGVGKSDGVQELADTLRKETGKKVVVTDVRLLLFSPVDLRGVPVADASRQFTDWLRPRIFNLDPSEDVINILFLDELSAAPQSIQAAAYQITLNRTVGEHTLPENTLIIAAGNRTTDRSVAFRMPNALANRLIHFEIGIDFDSWADWAIDHQVNPLVLGYLTYDHSKLFAEEVGLEEVAFRTPRSWMFVSNLLNALGENGPAESEDVAKYYTLISSCIGSGAALEFTAWCRVYKGLPKPEDVAQGRNPEYPRSQDALYALISALTAYISGREKQEDSELTLTELENICGYANKFPADFATCFYRNITALESIRLKLMKSVSFKEWTKKNRKALTFLNNRY